MLCAVLVALCGCGSSKSSSSSQATTTATSTPTAPPAPGASAGGSPTDTSQKPAIAKPAGTPPATLQIHDLVKGRGPRAKPGASVTVQYVGVSYSTGQQFDASWDRGQPFQFQLGAHMVIGGWDLGVAGMRVGGRRQLVIPPALAYGPQGQPPTIGPNETLIFDIDLLKVG
ncbi:MAG: hypothetical protein NVSMB25_24560 [Thermoleophilaceae bacterium]